MIQVTAYQQREGGWGVVGWWGGRERWGAEVEREKDVGGRERESESVK